MPQQECAAHATHQLVLVHASFELQRKLEQSHKGWLWDMAKRRESQCGFGRISSQEMRLELERASGPVFVAAPA
jgi:hypothetical protein